MAEEDRLALENGAALHVLRIESAGRPDERYLYLTGEERMGEPMVRAIAAGDEHGDWSFRPGLVLPGLLPSDLSQRPIGADQSNTTVVVGERLALKMYRRLEPGRHPDIEIGQSPDRAGQRRVRPRVRGLRPLARARHRHAAGLRVERRGRLGVGERRRCRRATSATSRGWVRTAAPCTARWRSSSRARPRRRAARAGAGRRTRSCAGCSSWWTRRRAPSCRATRRGCARSSRRSSRGRRRCSRACTATTTSARSCAPATACGWSTSRASRPRA